MQRKDDMPDIVYLGLMGINSKMTAYIYLVVCVIAAIGSFVLGYPLLGVLLVVAALWYVYSIRWVESNSSWDS